MMSIWETVIARVKRAVVLMLLTLASPALTAAVDIVVTVRPLQFIVEPLLDDQDSVTVLLDARDSPHHFNLTPSDRLAIADADLILWIGPEQEQALADFLQRTDAAGQRAIAATRLQGMTLHRLEEESIDPHVWLDPLNAVVLARSVAEELTALAPERSEEFVARAEVFAAAMSQLTDFVAKQVEGIQSQPFLVFHNAFQYFEERFGLRHSIALVNNPDVQPGMQSILLKRQQIEASGARCLLREPDANVSIIRTMTAASPSLRVTEVDLLGYGIEPDAAAYGKLLSRVADSFANCLSDDPE